jgi:hypothetical protein
VAWGSVRKVTNQPSGAAGEGTDGARGIQTGQCWKFHPRLTGCPQPNQALEPTPRSLRCAAASGRGSPRAFGILLCLCHWLVS